MEAAESQTAYVVVFLYYAIFLKSFHFHKPLYTESANKNCATRYPKAKDKSNSRHCTFAGFLTSQKRSNRRDDKAQKLAIKQSKCIPILRMKNDIGIPPYFSLLYHISTCDSSFVKYLSKSLNEIRIYTIQNKNQHS